jgi:ketosteroid isomerase-like protein
VPTAPPAFQANDVANYKEIMKLVESWAKAWNARDVDTYLSFYGRSFQTPEGMPRRKWEQTRRTRIQGKAYINVKIDMQQVAVTESGATVKFRQIYSSDRFTDDSIKTLMFAKQEGKWQIVQEYAGS